MATHSSKDSARKEALTMLSKYPGRLPVICLKESAGSSAVSLLPEKKKFLVPCDLLCDGFKNIIRKHIQERTEVDVGSDLQLFVGSVCIDGEISMQEVYDQHKADDCFLYVSCGLSQDSCSRLGPDCASREDMYKRGGTISHDARKLLARHPNNVPVVCERAAGSDAPTIGKNRFLVPCSMPCSEFKATLQKQFSEPIDGSADSIRLSVGGEVLDGMLSMEEHYGRYGAPDGFLYASYSLEPLDQARPEIAEEVACNKEQEEPVIEVEKEDVVPEACEKEVEELATEIEEEAGLVQQNAADDCSLECSAQIDLDQESSSQAINTQGSASDDDAIGDRKTSLEHSERRGATSSSVHLPDHDPETLDDISGVGQTTVSSPTLSPFWQAEGDSSSAVEPGTGGTQSEQNVPSANQELQKRHSTGSPDVSPEIAKHKFEEGSKRMTERVKASAEAAKNSGDDGSNIMSRFPGRVPVLCKKGAVDAPDISRSKFLVPSGMLCSEFKYLIYQQLTRANGLGVTDTIYLFVNKDVSPKSCVTMGELHAKYKAGDSFLHITYSIENTLGCC